MDHAPGSIQHKWFMDQVDLTVPTILAFHRHRYSAGGHGDQPDMEPFVAPYRGNRAVILNGHSHVYQRIVFDTITQFIVGSCGAACVGFYQRPDLAFGTCELGALRLELGDCVIRHSYRTPSGAILDQGVIGWRRPLML